MKKVLLLLFTPIIFNNASNHKLDVIPPSPSIIEAPIPTPIKLTPKPINELIDALIYVESRGKEAAIGDTHLDVPSVGVLQLRPIMVREVNRILKKQGKEKRYILKDRFSRTKSIEMFIIWKNYHHKDSNFEKIARNWNGGPNGYKYKRTEKYWERVQQQLKKQP